MRGEYLRERRKRAAAGLIKPVQRRFRAHADAAVVAECFGLLDRIEWLRDGRAIDQRRYARPVVIGPGRPVVREQHVGKLDTARRLHAGIADHWHGEYAPTLFQHRRPQHEIARTRRQHDRRRHEREMLG